MAYASLCKELFFSGAMNTDGTPVASGKAYFYVPGSTSVEVQAYGNSAATTLLTQPVTLDAAGKCEVYLKLQAEIIIKDATGAQILLTTNGSSVNGEQVEVTWGSEGAMPLQTALTEARAIFDTAAWSGLVQTVSTQTSSGTAPSFEFDTTAVTNLFSLLYAGDVGTFAVTWPSTPPDIAEGSVFRIVIKTASSTTCSTALSLPSQFVAAALATLAANKYYCADFQCIHGGTTPIIVQTTAWLTLTHT